MKAVFMGTPDFAVPSLQALLQEGHEVAAVVTQPDRPAGRGQSVRMSPVKQAALEHGIPVMQPDKVTDPDFVARLAQIAPDVIVVVAFGQKIPREILQMPRFGCVNVHGSLLPRYRGASPIHWAIIDGNKETGVTTMLMDEGWDTGDILLQESLAIEPEDTAGSLHDKLAELGARLLVKTLAGLEDGSVTPIPQDHSQANYVRMLKKEDGLLNWNQTPEKVVNFIRGMQPWPVAYTYLEGRMVKLWKAKALAPSEHTGGSDPGTVLAVNDEGLAVAVSCGVVMLLEVQPENSRRMTALDFANGYRVQPGHRFRSQS